mgnify:CR=1 FL=1
MGTGRTRGDPNRCRTDFFLLYAHLNRTHSFHQRLDFLLEELAVEVAGLARNGLIAFVEVSEGLLEVADLFVVFEDEYLIFFCDGFDVPPVFVGFLVVGVDGFEILSEGCQVLFVDFIEFPD